MSNHKRHLSNLEQGKNFFKIMFIFKNILQTSLETFLFPIIFSITHYNYDYDYL